jgi:hypothetical protein
VRELPEGGEYAEYNQSVPERTGKLVLSTYRLIMIHSLQFPRHNVRPSCVSVLSRLLPFLMAIEEQSVLMKERIAI